MMFEVNYIFYIENCERCILLEISSKQATVARARPPQFQVHKGRLSPVFSWELQCLEARVKVRLEGDEEINKQGNLDITTQFRIGKLLEQWRCPAFCG